MLDMQNGYGNSTARIAGWGFEICRRNERCNALIYKELREGVVLEVLLFKKRPISHFLLDTDVRKRYNLCWMGVLRYVCVSLCVYTLCTNFMGR